MYDHTDPETAREYYERGVELYADLPGHLRSASRLVSLQTGLATLERSLENGHAADETATTALATVLENYDTETAVARQRQMESVLEAVEDLES